MFEALTDAEMAAEKVVAQLQTFLPVKYPPQKLLLLKILLLSAMRRKFRGVPVYTKIF